MYLTPREDLSQQFEIRQDSTEIKHFFVREIRGEWMKLQLCIDYSSYFAVCVGALTTEAWEEISKHSESYPISLPSQTSTTSTPIIKSHIRLA